MPPTSLPETARAHAPDVATRKRRREVDPAAGEQVIVALIGGLADERRRLDDRLRAATRAAGDAGVTWERLGAALGMTRGGAWHYAHPEHDTTRAEQAG